jgi:hypothetical protein
MGPVDLTDGNTNQAIRIRVLSHDQPATLKMVIYSGADSCSEQSVTLPGNMSSKTLDVLLNFNDFVVSSCTNGGDLSAATAVVLQVSSSTGIGGGPLDMSLSFLDANTVTEFGDLPLDSYGDTVLGANHTQGGGSFLRLGTAMDTETTHNGSGSTNADGDDIDGSDDEDGAYPEESGGYWDAVVTVSGGGNDNYWVNGWSDWNSDGDFLDSGDHFITDTRDKGDGTEYYSFSPPSGELDGCYYVRFRVCDADNECNTPDGTSSAGEVEDYQWCFGTTSVKLSNVSVVAPAWWPAAAIAMLGAGAFGLVWRRRRS